MARRKTQRPSPAELEAQADELLAAEAEHDRKMLSAILENTQALRESWAQLKLPSDDPEYLRRLQTTEAQRNAIANKLTQIDIVPDGTKSWLSVGGFPHHEAKELAAKLAEHFETQIRQHDA